MPVIAVTEIRNFVLPSTVFLSHDVFLILSIFLKLLVVTFYLNAGYIEQALEEIVVFLHTVQ